MPDGSKTVTMVCGETHVVRKWADRRWHMGSTELPTTTEYKYLGIPITPCLNVKPLQARIERRCEQAHRAWEAVARAGCPSAEHLTQIWKVLVDSRCRFTSEIFAPGLAQLHARTVDSSHDVGDAARPIATLPALSSRAAKGIPGCGRSP